jgi:hypothetical protein
VIDFSEGGALIETTKGLPPGTMVDLQYNTCQQLKTVRGRVLRCSVVELRYNAVRYRAAIGFEYPLLTRECAAIEADGVNASHTPV